MNVTPRKTRRRPGTVRAIVLSVCAAGALSLTGCSGDGGAEAADGDAKASATATGGTQDKAGGKSGGTAGTPDAKASATPDAGTGKSGADPDASKPPAADATGSTASGGGSSGGGGSGGVDDGCDHKMPISPDEIAVYRYTPEGGSLSLIVKHGNWGCGTPDSDGAPFETVGKETYIPMDQAAAITVTDPVVQSTTNQPIGVQEFLDWIEAHPDSGLVFTYHLGDNGAIDRLDEVFTP
ncbi:MULTISPECIES: hypothetical protein [Streptomyces]|uniref:hypothetical protein n=1 Tax=Streptomyces TaxID=1883 RepID=UPI0005EEE2FC|nr:MULTISPECIES: hypothetical protein [unclassified Streptomyces]UJV46012.1 hypothetical protein CVT30_44645 [Streptomyces sp. AMCC400023]